MARAAGPPARGEGPPSGPPSETSSETPSGPSAVLGLIPAVYFVFVAAEFGTMTHLALTLTAAGRSAFSVGLLATGLWAGILAASTAAHGVIQRHGHARVFVGATGVATLALGSMALHGAYAGWLAAAVLLGWCGGLVWVAGEAWLAEAAPRERRGFYVGLFETAVGLGLMAGPALVPLSRALGASTPWVSALLMASALGFSLRLLAQASPSMHDDAESGAPGDRRRSDWRALAVPLCAVAAVSGLMEAGVSSLMPSVGMRLGFSIDAAAWLGTVIGAGSALLQPPAGHLADRWGTRRSTLAAWGVVMVANALLLGVALAGPAGAPGQVSPLLQAALFGIGFVLGGVGGAVYTLIIVELGHRLEGSALVRAVGLLVTSYAVGTAAGPALGGALFDAAGLAGALLVCGAAGLLLAARALRGPGPADRP